MIDNGCIDMEQTAYDGLKSGWGGISSRTQTYCDEVARVTGGCSLILEGCITLEAEATNGASTFKH